MIWVIIEIQFSNGKKRGVINPGLTACVGANSFAGGEQILVLLCE